MSCDLPIIDLLKKTGGLLEGHFLLSSGLHSPKYLQCAKMLQHPEYAQSLAEELSKNFRSTKIDVVVGPAIGGIVIAHEVARVLGARCIFTEREGGKMCLRRGFRIEKDEKILVVEDVITTGGSILETIKVVESFDGEVVGVATLIDRSGGKVDLGIFLTTLLKLEIETFTQDTCPLCQKGLSLIKPGSREKS